jgi:hypothetical protein
VSRDQKPGKFKLVGVAAPNPGRRRDDKQPDPASDRALAASGQDGAADPLADVKAPARSGLLQPLLFILCCAIGAAGAVFFGLVGGLPA